MKNKKGQKRKYFDSVDTKVSFPELETKLLKDWYSKGIVGKYLKKNDNSNKYFSFLDGPITANNPMGVHHAWGRTYKDLWQRFNNMLGMKQRFQNGFDCQGLWVEVEVEKELGLKNKKEIENLVPGDRKKSIAKFVELCKKRVYKYADIQTEQSKRLGYFMDWDNSYFTMSEANNYMIWHYLKVCNDNGWIYKGKDSVPWCPRCETAISQHEMLTEDYKEVKHTSIYMKLPIEGREKEYLLVWTTTPWTIPANIAVAVDKNLDYSLVKKNTESYWVASNTIERIFDDEDVKVVKIVKGEELVGLKYDSAFDGLPAVKKVSAGKHQFFHTVVPTDERIMPISEEEGTGLVHTAVSAGAEDYKLGKKLGLPMIPVIDDRADYLEGLGFLSGKNAKKHPEIVLDYMKKEGFAFKTHEYLHRYPACWRCKTELVWKVTGEWYIAMDKKSDDKKGNVHSKSLRLRMIDVAKSIEWIPGFGLDRELDWLNNMHDWLISKKNRYWGLAIPIWECNECGNFEVIGSKDELKKRAVSGWEEFKGHTPHKPYIDQVKIKCSNCGKVISRIPDVGNPWLDAGIVPYSTIAEENKEDPLYLKNKKKWEKWFPADFITESFPGQFKNWFYSMIAMSTVLENRKPFKTVLGFGTLLAEDGRPMHKSWGNAIEFNEGAQKIGVDVMRWMYLRQNPSDNLLFGYRNADEVRRKFLFKLWNIYNYFTTYANIDGWKPDRGSSKKSEVVSDNILDKWLLTRLKQTLEVVETELKNYNASRSCYAIEELVDDFSNWHIRRSRQRTGKTATSKKDNQEFYRTTFFTLLNLTKIMAPFTPFISELIYRNLTKEETVHLVDWPEFDHKIDSLLLKEMVKIREVVEAAHAQRKDKKIPVRQPLNSLATSYPKPKLNLDKLVKDEVNVKNVAWASLKGDELKVKLDTRITPELKEEAKTRELIRSIQQKRKELGIGLTQKITVKTSWLPLSKELVQKIKNSTLSSEIVKNKGELVIESVN